MTEENFSETAKFIAMKAKKEKIAMITCYDSSMAKLLSNCNIDMLLVGDSVGMVKLGYKDTLSVTMGDMIHHTKAVKNGNTGNIFLVSDMPYKSYEDDPLAAVSNAKKLISAGADAVKVEGGAEIINSVDAVIGAGIPVVGHLGMTPQSVNKLGGFKVQCRDGKSVQKLLEDALALEKSGVFAIVFECIPEKIGAEVSEKLNIPSIGIGAGRYCDGQVLVSDDLLGMFTDFTPKFVKKYADLSRIVQAAAQQYSFEVKNGRFPQEGNVYK